MILFCISNTVWTALTAIGTIAMAIATFCTLRQNDKLIQENKNELEELKKQWYEENRPKLEISLVRATNTHEFGSTFLQILNYGKGVANNVQISFDESFIAEIINEALRQHLTAIQNKILKILPNRSILIEFCCFQDNRSNQGYSLCGNEITYIQKNEIIDFLKKPFRVSVQYGNNNMQYTQSNELSQTNLSARETSIQEELSYIQMQLALFRTNLNSVENKIENYINDKNQKVNGTSKNA